MLLNNSNKEKRMTGFQSRVVDERDLLKLKINALANFVNGETFKGLSPLEAELLTRQLDIMNAYLHVLDMRIANFK